MRLKAKRDTSEAAIVERLEHHGAKVTRLSGTNLPDLLVLYRGTLRLVEVKTGKAKLKPGQLAFSTAWPVEVLRTAEDASSWLLNLAPHQVRSAAKSTPTPVIWDEVP